MKNVVDQLFAGTELGGLDSSLWYSMTWQYLSTAHFCDAISRLTKWPYVISRCVTSQLGYNWVHINESKLLYTIKHLSWGMNLNLFAGNKNFGFFYYFVFSSVSWTKRLMNSISKSKFNEIIHNWIMYSWC